MQFHFSKSVATRRAASFMGGLQRSWMVCAEAMGGGIFALRSPLYGRRCGVSLLANIYVTAEINGNAMDG